MCDECCVVAPAGYGSTDANPTVCSLCPQGSYNAGPQPDSQPRALAGASEQQQTAVNSPGTHSTYDDVGAEAAASSSSSSGSSSEDAYTLAEVAMLHSAEGVGAQQAQVAGQAHYDSGSAGMVMAAAAAGVFPQQTPDSWEWLRGTGVNPVFYTPTYNPCTPCGPACYTNSPGATSALACSEWDKGDLAVRNRHTDRHTQCDGHVNTTQTWQAMLHWL